ncbi:RraA family protein [Aestuariivirga litoralis]|uniref:RraA family protein n=1 Tax=Aestuariivirga litoralis TaxID=2650924 RepID=UPI0018C5E74B|nr:dimethylmenaquinone methyltransferase [Aestuariivirga litoralis]MBG1232125.1 dimethylmenaquinone methyltransferase [Aestuariivirga litoralis]
MMGETIPQSLLERWARIPVAVIADTSHGACLIDPAIRPLCPAGQQPKLFGRAVTALCAPPDFGAVLRALDEMARGDVLVIAAQSNAQHAMIGEILGGHLRRIGAVGVICDGAVRDVAELAGWKDISVYSRSITPRGPTGAAAGEVNVPVTFGGVLISPGDLVIGNDDGLATLTPARAQELIGGCEAKLTLEDEWQKSLASGKTIAQTFGLKAKSV